MKSKSLHSEDWGVGILDQGRLIEGHKRVLVLAGQVSVQEDSSGFLGLAAKHPNKMRLQFREALSKIQKLLEQANMTVDDIIHMRYFVTDMEAGLKHCDVVLEWFGDSDNRPPQSFIGVNELFVPNLMIEIEATAATS